MKKRIYISIVLIFIFHLIYGQNKWLKSYYSNKDAVGKYFSTSYDHGIYIVGKHGHNYVPFNWLIKTDINGEILWEKTIGESESYIGINYIDCSNSGSLFCVGSTTYYDDYKDPFILKLNACGEKGWCKVYYTPNNHDYASYVIAINGGGCITTLRYTGIAPDDRICLARFSDDGDMLWKECYNSADTGLVFEDSRSITITPDNGYLISAVCDYEDPTNPGHYLSKPYYIKTDSNGIFQWEQVVFKDDLELGGNAWHTVVNPDTTCYYSCISKYYYSDARSAPALVKLGLNGEILGVYDIIDGYVHGGLARVEFLNDSILAASIGWGNSEDEFINYAALIDTLGNLIDTTVLSYDIYSSELELTFDRKLLYMYNTYQSNQFDVYLRKLNQDLEDDSIYTFPYVYDSLCPYQILSDTIVQDDCGLIVGNFELPTPKDESNTLEIYPNPATNQLNCRFQISDSRFQIWIYDMLGGIEDVVEVPKGLSEIQIDVSNFTPGIYIAILKAKREIIAKTKFIKK